MQENNYQEQTEEIKTVYDEQIMTANDTIYTLEQQLKEIQKNNIIFEQELRKQAELYGVTPEELKINPEFTFKVQDENGMVRKIKRQNEETIKNELSRKKQLRDSLILFRNKEISQIRKKERDERIQGYNRKGIIEEARKFFTYLDTKTTIGTKYSTLSDDELIDFYNSFYQNKDKPGYKKIWDETIERMKKNDRDIDEFYISSLIKDNKENGMSEEEATKEAIKQFQEKYPTKPIPVGYEKHVEQPEPTPVEPELPPQQVFNNNSTTLLTEGQILALRNRGYNVPFNKPGQKRLSAEQIKVINSAGISTVDLTEPGSKTVEELTGMPDPTQKENIKEQQIIHEYVEIPKELTNQNENILNAQQTNTQEQITTNIGLHR